MRVLGVALAAPALETAGMDGLAERGGALAWL